jgi:hypothetical protein
MSSRMDVVSEMKYDCQSCIGMRGWAEMKEAEKACFLIELMLRMERPPKRCGRALIRLLIEGRVLLPHPTILASAELTD